MSKNKMSAQSHKAWEMDEKGRVKIKAIAT